nr:hypothetical protein [Tanacetum cinerariifolium]
MAYPVSEVSVKVNMSTNDSEAAKSEMEFTSTPTQFQPMEFEMFFFLQRQFAQCREGFQNEYCAHRRLMPLAKTGPDGAEERTFQIPLEIVSGVDVNFISLLVESRSLVLYRCVATEDESSYLIVLNLYNMSVVELDGLHPINFNVDFGNWVHHTFRCVTDIDRMSFDISHAALPHHDFAPRRLELSSLNGWNITAATPLQIEQHEHFVEPVEGWNSTHHCLFGKDGYVVLFKLRQTRLLGRKGRRWIR